MTDKDVSLTVTMYRNDLVDGIVVRLHDNITPGEEVRYAQRILSNEEIAAAPSRGLAWYRHMQLLVDEFNKMSGKKVKLINTFGIFGVDDEVPVHIIPLPYSMGLIYYSKVEPCPEESQQKTETPSSTQTDIITQE